MSDETEYLGCGDGGCDIERPRGQHTNGGCKCLRGMRPDALLRLRTAIARDRKRIDELERQLAALHASHDGGAT